LLAFAAFQTATAQTPELGFLPDPLAQDEYSFPTAEAGDIRVKVVVRGFNRPFSLAFLPNGDALVSERGAGLRLIRNATGNDARLVAEEISGAPPHAVGRGSGLQEIAVHPDYARNQMIYFSHNEPRPARPAGNVEDPPPLALVISRARLIGNRLEDIERIYDAGPRQGSSGSRLAFAGDGSLYVTTGAPAGREAQSLDSPYGKVLRIRADGAAPSDNPFVGRANALPEIVSLGHRDQLGLAIHAATGTVFAAEHGPNGGDEINLILPGRNYGWPDFSYGRNYDGPRISAQPLGDDTEQPLILWVPSIAPTGLSFYTAERIPAWTGNLFIGSARRGQIPGTGGLERVVLNERFEELRRESLLGDLRRRIRDVRQGPDGLLYVITDETDGALLRLSPAAD